MKKPIDHKSSSLYDQLAFFIFSTLSSSMGYFLPQVILYKITWAPN